MLIGAHVSPAGGPANAVARASSAARNAIQIFNQNPRAWKPRVYTDDETRRVSRRAGGKPTSTRC